MSDSCLPYAKRDLCGVHAGSRVGLQRGRTVQFASCRSALRLHTRVASKSSIDIPRAGLGCRTLHWHA